MLWPTESLPNLRKVTLERAKSSAELLDDIDMPLLADVIGQKCIY